MCGLGHLDGSETLEFVLKLTEDVLELSVGGPEGRFVQL